MAMMFGSTILEVAIGLLFVYMLLSLLCSAVGEYIEAKFNNRAKYLKKGITLLLNDTTGGGVDLAAQLYAHGLVRPFYRDGATLPSYIPSRTFALALWNIASTAAAGGASGDAPASGSAGVTTDVKAVRAVVATHLPNRELRTALLTLIDEAQGDIEKARRNIEEWYDGMMDRVSGWYKRRTTVLMLLLGFVVAAVVNADTINIANALARDGALRSSLVAAAEQRIRTPVSTTTAGGTPEEVDAQATRNLHGAYDAVNALGLPIGWTRATQSNKDDRRRVPDTFGEFFLKLVGILVTGLAISQGAPFWFDVLNKFMVVRSTVKPSEKSGEQPSKDRPAPKAQTEPGETEATPTPKG
jgi:hypothetical protein